MHAAGSAPRPTVVGRWHRIGRIGPIAPIGPLGPTAPIAPIARPVLSLALAIFTLTACGTGTVSPQPASIASSGSPSASASVSPTASDGVEPAPGSDSAVYSPNPGAIVVAIDAGHGGCLDWGVPDPSARGVEWSEKTMTLGIARRLRDLLEADGVHVVMIRDDDTALAGDDYEPLGCSGAAWRDVNGDGLSGFGPDLPEATRTRDELQARLDLANVARADALVSIHINAPSEGGQQVEIAFTQTFYTDETPWGPTVTERLATDVQEGVVAALDAAADYDRGDRGIDAHNFYIVAPPLAEPTPDRPDPVKQPTRGGLMPVVLSEVGSITLRAEQDLLAGDAGQAAVAAGLFEGLAAFFSERELAARIAPDDQQPGALPTAAPGAGPPFWAPVADGRAIRLRVTNTGTEAWPAGTQLVAGWQETDGPYLAFAPDDLVPLGDALPALEPGESTVVERELPAPPAGRAVAWISLMIDGESLADSGSPAFQLSSEAP
jgi:N-acetylmuramoyl-L-alanine amidase